MHKIIHKRTAMKINKIIILLATILGLIGCAAPLPSINDVDPNKLTNQQAMLIVSTGADETCISFSSTVVVKQVDKKPSILSSIGVMQINNDFVKSDFKEEYGKVYTLVLQPGEYDFWLNSQNPYMKIKDPIISEPVTLLPKQIKYVGEIHSDGCGSMLISIKNKMERDIAFLQTINAKLDIEKINMEQLKLKQKD